MFKKLRKLYFKIYHLFKLIGIFILIFGIKRNVYAIETIPFQTQFKVSEESCTENLMNPIFINQARLNSGRNVYTTCTACYASQLIKVKPNTTYKITISRGVGNFVISGLANETSNANLTELYGQNMSYTTGSNINYIVIYMASNAWGNISTFNITMSEGAEATEEEFKTTCVPPGPVQDEVYSSFLEIYKDRLIYLTEGFTTNPYLIAMIGIIISFIVLELLLKIINIGRNRRK